MKKTIVSLFVLAIGLVVVATVSDPGASLVPSTRAVAPSPPTAITSSPVDRLPGSTLVAVELRGIARRWEEIRSLPWIARFQDRVLHGCGLAAHDLPKLTGDRAVLALVAGDGLGSVMPLALLRPPRPAEAAALLEKVVADGDPLLAVQRAGDTLWVAPARAAERLKRLARDGSTSSDPGPAFEELSRRLPPGGLARGWLHAVAIRDLLRNRVEGTLSPPVDVLASIAAAELDAVRVAGFRRELTFDGVTTDLVVGYETGALPAEVARALASPTAPSLLPPTLPAGVVAIAAFRPEPEASLAWLRYVAASDPRGPLRNLEFWIEQLEERSGVDIERDLVGALGERGWLVVLVGDTGDTLQCVAIVETGDAPRLEKTLVELRSWWADHALGRSLGLAVPRAWDEESGAGVLHGTTFWTPLGELPGPLFLVTERHLVLASGKRALESGLRLLETERSWEIVRGPRGAPAQESLLVDGGALAPVLSVLLADADAGTAGRLGQAVEELVGDLGRISLGVWYETDALRLRGEVRFVERASGGR